MINLELTEDQAKLLLILSGMCTGHNGSRGVYQMLYKKLNVLDHDHQGVYDPIVSMQGDQLYSLEITESMLQSIPTFV